MLFAGTFVFVTFACLLCCKLGMAARGWQKASEEESVILTLKAEGTEKGVKCSC